MPTCEFEGDPQPSRKRSGSRFRSTSSGSSARARHRPRLARQGGVDRAGLRRAHSGIARPMLPVDSPHTPAAGGPPTPRWRHSTLDLAKERAPPLDCGGAAFPGEPSRGPGVPATGRQARAAFHINADIAAGGNPLPVGDRRRDAGDRRTGDTLVETARLWISLRGHHDLDGVWHIAGVTGPDEYNRNRATTTCSPTSAAAHNLRSAAEAAERHPRHARDLGITLEEVAASARGGRCGQHPVRPRPARAPTKRGVHPVATLGLRGVPRQVPVAATRAVLRPVPPSQVIKQADLLLCPVLVR